MATSPRNAEAISSQEFGPRLAAGTAPAGAPPKAAGFDALQALLAFSSLHEQIRARRAAAGATGPKDSPDQFVLYEVLQLVAERARALTGADGIAIALVQEGEIICRATTGAIAPEIGARLDPRYGLSGICFLSGEMVRCDDAENDPRVNLSASRNLHARSILAVPLRGRRSVIGLLEAFSSDAFAFSESDIRGLSLLAELILGAMKPEEEEKLEALSPALINSRSTDAAVCEAAATIANTASSESECKTPLADADGLPPEISAENSAAACEIPPALLRDYEKLSHSPSGTVALAAVAVLLVIACVGAALWKFRTPAQAVSWATGATLRQSKQASASPSPATPMPVAADLPQPNLIPADDANRNVLPLLTGVRHWESGDSTTVALDLQDQVQYEVHRLSSPERIYFDLHDTVLAPRLNGMIIDVGNDLLIRIRVAEPVAGVARVVLDTKNVSNFSVGLQPNPYRLIIQIRRSADQQPPKENADLSGEFRSATGESLLSPSAATMSKEDLQLRARVPHLKIVIDAGHGGWDFGTVGSQGVVEKDLVLDISQRLGELLQTRLGSEILYTRSADAYVPLEERAEIANDGQADLFISVHANNSDSPSARGVETYYTNVSAPANSLEIEKRENATATRMVVTPALSDVELKERTAESRHLAASVERALYSMLSTKNPGVRDRGVKEAGFVVLTGTTMPAILAEVSFVSSPADERNLQTPPYRQRIAEALYKGIARYAAAISHVKLASAR